MDPEVKSPPIVSRRPLPFILLALALILIITGLFLYIRSRKNQDFVSGLVTDPETSLTATNGRTNLLFLGFGGDNHEGEDLTDSMIFVSLSHATHSVSMLSIPRDIWVDTMVAKVNTAYHYGNERREGGGLDLAKSAVGEITGQPVHYALALDFQGFVQAIDAVGGIDIEVKNSFDDYKYPVPGKENVEPESDRYEHLHFEAGPAHLDGTTALKFARSRHAEGDEGTDFARSARQLQIILAFKDKLISSDTLLNLDRLRSIFASFQDNIDTDIKEQAFGSFFRFFLAFQQTGQNLTPLNFSDLFTTPKNRSPYQGQWVLAPVGFWSEIHDYVAKNLAE